MKTITKILKITSVFLLCLSSKIGAQTIQNGTTILQVVRGISPNGNYIVGQSGEPRQAFTWTPSGVNSAATLLGGSAGAGRLSEAYDVSNNNRVIGSFADPNLIFDGGPIRSAGFWENDTWTGLGLGLAKGAAPQSLIAGSHAAAVTA
ncbi:MAG: hypothetical protein LBH22_01815, partial [Bacteroidales bacterium]|nr:hypothetical protein [Bacteroidales bacterium]